MCFHSGICCSLQNIEDDKYSTIYFTTVHLCFKFRMCWCVCVRVLWIDIYFNKLNVSWVLTLNSSDIICFPSIFAVGLFGSLLLLLGGLWHTKMLKHSMKYIVPNSKCVQLWKWMGKNDVKRCLTSSFALLIKLVSYFGGVRATAAAFHITNMVLANLSRFNNELSESMR